MGTPAFHPKDEDLSMGTPAFHPTDEELSVGISHLRCGQHTGFQLNHHDGLYFMTPTDPNAPFNLTAAQARVLGALVEKEVTTPEYYPLSLNALISACNQRSNREPVMNLDEEAVRMALHGLEDRRLAGRARAAEGRVTKYEHWLGEAFNFSRAETALICLLLLRGPQTPGELRGRTERMHRFEEIGDVLAGVQKLMEREPALVAVLPRQPGTKEARYAHLLSGAAAAAESTFAQREAGPYAEGLAEPDAGQAERIAQLEAEVAELRQEMSALRQKIDDLFGD